MRHASFALLAVLILAASASLEAGDAAGPSQVAMAFTGGSTWTSQTTGICMWYLPLVGDLELKALFKGPLFGEPVVDREHAYLLWVSDFSVQVLPSNKGFNLLALVPTGTGTIYYSDRPEVRDFTDLTDRRTWGRPVATFVRKNGLYQSADGGATASFIFSAELESSSTFTVNGKTFDFRDLMPHGMTCHETGINGAEAGTCLAHGK